MASAFDTRFQTVAWPQLLTQHGQAATYRAPTAGAVAQACTIILSPRLDTVVIGESGVTSDEARVTISVSAADLAPVRHGAFTVNSTTYIVEVTPTERAGVFECPCRIREQVALNDRRRE